MEEALGVVAWVDLGANHAINQNTINENNEDTYLGMTMADILVTSSSSYSYSAAFFCKGDIYYTEFWHKPCSWWNKLPKYDT